MFHDEAGRAAPLSTYFGAKPVILTLNYFECPNLCTLVLTRLTDAMRELSFDIGQQFNVVTVSIDPREKPDLAAAKKAVYLDRYGKPDAAGGWHFLTGDQRGDRAAGPGGRLSLRLRLRGRNSTPTRPRWSC